MKMVPFYDMYGTILGHVNVNMCRRTRTSIMLDNGPSDWLKGPVPTDRKTISSDDSVEIFHLRYRKIEFRCRDHLDTAVYHLVVEADTIPSWFWKAKAVVEFFPHSWREVR